MYVCIMDQSGTVLMHKNLPAQAEAFLRTIAPYQADIVVAVECIFTWYWIADLCNREGIPFVLGHALYMKAIHGGKTKNDKIDSQKIAAMLRGGMLPMAYTYPKAYALNTGSASASDVPGASTRGAFSPYPEYQLLSTTARHSERRSPTRSTAWGSPRPSTIQWYERASRWTSN